MTQGFSTCLNEIKEKLYEKAQDANLNKYIARRDFVV